MKVLCIKDTYSFMKGQLYEAKEVSYYNYSKHGFEVIMHLNGATHTARVTWEPGLYHYKKWFSTMDEVREDKLIKLLHEEEV